MRINRVKQALREGKVQLGTGFAQLRSLDVPKILSAAGFHWAFLDGEHGGFGIETLQDLCRASVSAALSPVVRVADLQYALVARALDCGAEGIIFPRVESPELLERAVSWTKYPPVGIRGCGILPLQVDFEPVTVSQITEHFNEHTLVVLQIETLRALEARDELLSVRHVDAVMVGPVDLSISLGVPGDFQNPKMVDAMEKIVASCKSHGVIPGTQTRNVPLARFWKERGMLFLGCSNETSMLFDGAKSVASALTV